LGTLRGQDVGKAVFLVAMVAGSVLAVVGVLLGTQAFRPLLQLFTDFK
jgi:hypothetical protein